MTLTHWLCAPPFSKKRNRSVNYITTLFRLNPQTRVPSDFWYWYFMLTQRQMSCRAVEFIEMNQYNKKIGMATVTEQFWRPELISVLIPHFFRIISVPLRTTASKSKDDFRARTFFLFQLFSSVTLMMWRWRLGNSFILSRFCAHKKHLFPLRRQQRERATAI